MSFRNPRLELAFQFLFLLDSSGAGAVDETAEQLANTMVKHRKDTLALIESWASGSGSGAGGTHGDSSSAVAGLTSRLTDAVRTMVTGFLQIEADRPAGKAAAPAGPDFTAWSSEVRDVYARSYRDNLTASGAREAMEPLFASVNGIFDDADAVVAEAVEMAQEAMTRSRETDRITTQLAPAWPPHRQAATDRAILRLGRSEMLAGRTPPKWVVHHCVNLAKRYSTEKSPSFVNALLDKMLKQVLAEDPARAAQSAGDAESDAPIEGDAAHVDAPVSESSNDENP
jgi:transcription termination factor NusB